MQALQLIHLAGQKRIHGSEVLRSLQRALSLYDGRLLAATQHLIGTLTEKASQTGGLDASIRPDSVERPNFDSRNAIHGPHFRRQF